ncbi:hypothetical protein CsatB_029612 [Cannabis sativa]
MFRISNDPSDRITDPIRMNGSFCHAYLALHTKVMLAWLPRVVVLLSVFMVDCLIELMNPLQTMFLVEKFEL